jgi:hypothetical protein
MREKRKSTSPSPMQVKNRPKTINTGEKLDAINRLEKMNKLLTYGVMLDSLIAAFVQLAIMLIE